MGLLSKLFKLICIFGVIFGMILIGPSNLPDSAKFTEFFVTPTKYLGENLKDNNLLNNAERLFENEIKGPEGFEIVNGELYTTLHGGYVAKVFDDQVIPVAKFGESCEGWWEESKCGRPLGIKVQGNDLIVADAYYGIFKYNTKTGKSVPLINKDTVIARNKPKIFNAVEVAKNGLIYWTHSSSDFDIEDGLFAFLADGSGRLLKYDPVTQENTVLLDNLYFANGLILSPEEDYLLVAETGHSRVLKFYLTGPKKFMTEIFIDGLPGMPDNLRSTNAGYFIPLVVTRDENHPAAFQVIAPYPNLRKFAAKFLSLIELFLDKVQKIYPNYFVKRALHYIGHLESVGMLLPLKTTVLEVDVKGNVIKSYHGSDGSVTSISDVISHNGYLWLGSPVNNYLARIKLSELDKSPFIKQQEKITDNEVGVKESVTISASLSTARPQKSQTTTREDLPPSTTESTKKLPVATISTTTRSPPSTKTQQFPSDAKMTSRIPTEPPKPFPTVNSSPPNVTEATSIRTK